MGHTWQVTCLPRGGSEEWGMWVSSSYVLPHGKPPKSQSHHIRLMNHTGWESGLGIVNIAVLLLDVWGLSWKPQMPGSGLKNWGLEYREGSSFTRWCLGWEDSKTALRWDSIGTPVCGLFMKLGLPHSMAASAQLDFLGSELRLQEWGCWQTREVCFGLLWSSLKNHTVSNEYTKRCSTSLIP